MSKEIAKRELASDILDYLDDELDTLNKESDVIKIKIDLLDPFHDHPFKLYEGQKLDDMVESIREHGVMIPILARKRKGRYEILSGHNRVNAARISGLEEVPVFLKDELTEKEAYAYVIETNLIQRGFAELLPSEQAAALEIEYSKVISQGKKNEIIREIEKMSGIESTSGQSDQKLTKRDAIGNEYGLSGSSMARMLRINHLIQPFKDMVDKNSIAKGAYFHISFLPEEMQGWIYNASEENGYKISEEIAKMFRSSEDMLTEAYVSETIKDLMSGKKKDKKYENVKINTVVYRKYFDGVDSKDAVVIIEKALENYFAETSEEGKNI